MQKFQDFAKIVGVEMPDGVKELNKLPDNRGNWRTAVRIVVEFATADNMTEKQRALYEKASEEQKRIMQANKVRLQYSGLFNAENIIPNFATPENGCNDAQLAQVVAKVKEIFANIGNTAIFTLYEFSVSELKEGLAAVYTQDGVKLTSRSRLFFDFFDDDEAAKRMLTTSLLQRLDDEELLETNPNETTPTPAPAFNILRADRHHRQVVSCPLNCTFLFHRKLLLLIYSEIIKKFKLESWNSGITWIP